MFGFRIMAETNGRGIAGWDRGPLGGFGPVGWLAVVLWAAGLTGTAAAQDTGWVGPLVRLRAAPVDLSDQTRPAEERVAALRALGRYGAERDAVPPLVAALAPTEPPLVRVEAAEALARRGATGSIEALVAALDPHGQGFDPAVVAAAAHALAAIGGEAALEALARARDEPLTAVAATRALAWREPRTLVAAERAPDVAALVARAEQSATHARATALTLAIGLRRSGRALAPDVVARARRVLATLDDVERRMFLRALARDPGVAAEVERALSSSDPLLRATAARGVELLRDGALARPLAQALAVERDGEAFRCMVEAALVLELRVEPRVLASMPAVPETAPEALLLAALAAAGAPDRALRTRLRRALRARGEPRLRAAAAHALALAGDRTADAVLTAALDDGVPQVRLAALRALAVLATPAAARVLAAHARIERDADVLSASRFAVRTLGLGQRLALRSAGEEVLEARVSVPGSAAEARVSVEVTLPEGRVRLLRTLPSGELVVADLPAGEVHVVLVGGS